MDNSYIFFLRCLLHISDQMEVVMLHVESITNKYKKVHLEPLRRLSYDINDTVFQRNTEVSRRGNVRLIHHGLIHLALEIGFQGDLKG